MTLDWTKFNVAYNKADEGIKSLINSETLPNCASNICLKYALNNELKKSLVVCALNKLLELETDDIILSNLEKEGIPNEASHSIIIEIEQCIIENTSQKLEANNIYNQIAETEASLSSTPSLRTMSNDIKNVPQQSENTYTSMQSAILGEGKQ